jgi:hypothetical protein
MELEELKNSRYAIKAPQELSGKTMGTTNDALSNLMERLKTEDARQLSVLRRAKPLWWIAAVCWVVASVGIVMTDLASPERFGSGISLRGLLALVFLGLAVGFTYQVRKLSAIDYAEPTSRFLQSATRRYKFMSTPCLVLSVLVTSVLALTASPYIVSVFERYFNVQNSPIGTVSTFAFVAAVYAFGYYVSRKAWKKERQPMFEEIRRMQEGLRVDPHRS